ncbi:MAG TPA: hypothetical protein VI653_03165 [Steroidobacteraceae bacterium]
MTDTIDALENNTARAKTAGKPNFQPTSPDSKAPTALPAWLYAWLSPF